MMPLAQRQESLVAAVLGWDDAPDATELRLVPNDRLDLYRDAIAHDRLELGLRAFPATSRLLSGRIPAVAAAYARASVPRYEMQRLVAEVRRLRAFLSGTYLGLPSFAGDLIAYEAELFALRSSETARRAAPSGYDLRVPAAVPASKLELHPAARLLRVGWNVPEIATALIERELVFPERASMLLVLLREAAEMAVTVVELDEIAYAVAEAAERSLRVCDVSLPALSLEPAPSLEVVLDRVTRLLDAGIVQLSDD